MVRLVVVAALFSIAAFLCDTTVSLMLLVIGLSVSYAVSVAGSGIAIQKTVLRTGDGPIGLETSMSAGKTVTNWVKTDANTAACDLPGGHGYANGNFDVFWSGGRRYNVPGTIATNALTLDGGGGDDFPASATSGVVVSRNVEATLSIDGDNCKILAVVAESTDPNSTARAHLTFEDSAGDDIALVDLEANVPQVWDIEGGATNSFTGDPITKVQIGAEAELTIKIVGIQDATP